MISAVENSYFKSRLWNTAAYNQQSRRNYTACGDQCQVTVGNG